MYFPKVSYSLSLVGKELPITQMGAVLNKFCEHLPRNKNY